MADFNLFNIDTDPPTQYTQYDVPQSVNIEQTFTGDTTIITTINGGGGGRATGPSITLGSNWSGVNFVASGNNLNLDILNEASARADLGAAASGVNGDINSFTALTGSGGWSAWTGTPDKTSHATFSGTASVGYVQAEMQAVMDSLQQVTEGFMALLATLFAWGGVKP